MNDALKRTFGCNFRALAIFRITLSSLLLAELILRFRVLHPFYSDEGTFPARFLHPTIDNLYKTVCLHCLSGSLFYQQLCLAVQVLICASFLLGYRTQLCARLSWFLYLSLTLRNTWLSFILDRYFHYMLFYSMFLPTGTVWSVDAYRRNRSEKGSGWVAERGDGILVSPATVFLKLQILWIYLDAGGGKFMDPEGGWRYDASPLPALDTYTRHTIGARYVYALLGPQGLRLLTPSVVYVELLSAPLIFLGSYLGSADAVNIIIGVICSLHLGIAVCLRNTVLLSLVACSAWMVFLPRPMFNGGREGRDGSKKESTMLGLERRKSSVLAGGIICCFILGSVWFETLSEQCDQSMEHIWSTLLHNRWNVFVGAEEYVTWEIAPGRLADNSIVDVWSKSPLSWEMPGTGTPCTSTSRPGRWRSFPYLAELGTEETHVLWNYLCHQWDQENQVTLNAGKKLLRFNFFMMQADILPNMGFSASRKRLIYSHVCDTEEDQEDGSQEEMIERRREWSRSVIDERQNAEEENRQDEL